MLGIYYMSQIHPYDRCMAITSLFILLPIFHITIPLMPTIMTIQTFASVAHWLIYKNKIFHLVDQFLSITVFIWNVWHLIIVWPTQACKALISASVSVIFFRKRIGMREKMLISYRFIYVLPHTTFRFFAFWFVMLLHGQSFSLILTIFYWFMVFFLSIPYPMPLGQSWKKFLQIN